MKDLDEGGRIRGLKLLEMQRHALLMYTSCGWFFADLAGLETVQILLYAARAIELAERLSGQEIEKKFIQYLSKAKSNLPEIGDGRQVYQKLVKPRCIQWDRVVNHYAISSLFDEGGKEKKIYSYRLEKVNYEKREKDSSLLVLGQVRVTSEIIPETKEYLFGLISSDKDIFRTWVAEGQDVLKFHILMERAFESLGKDEEEMARVLTSLLGNRTFTIRDVFKEEKQAIFRKLIQEELDEHRRIYAEIFDKTRQMVEALVRGGLEIPYEIRVAAEVTLSDRLLYEVKNLEKDFRGIIERGEIDQMMDEARACGFKLRMEEPGLILSGLLKERMETLHEAMSRHFSASTEEGQWITAKVEEVSQLLDLNERWGFKLQKEEAQNLMGEMLKVCIESLEKSWWGESVEKPFFPNFILLAEKLDFNVEKFLKIMDPAISTGLS
jgi:hypothetical protein